MTRLMRPLTLSIFCARLAVSRPTPPKVTEPSALINAMENNGAEHSQVKENHAEDQQQTDLNEHQEQAAGHNRHEEISPRRMGVPDEALEQLALASCPPERSRCPTCRSSIQIHAQEPGNQEVVM